jgi:hypothetical protein
MQMVWTGMFSTDTATAAHSVFVYGFYYSVLQTLSRCVYA